MVYIATTNTKHSSTAIQININPPTRSLFVLHPITQYIRGSLVAQVVKNLPAMRETQIQSLGWEDPLEEEMAIHPNILAWNIPWTEEPGGHSPWGSKESDMTE